MYLRNRLTIPVKGFNRSVIYDLTRSDYYFISNEVFQIINTNDTFNIEDDETREFLLKEEIIFEINLGELTFFPELSLKFETPYDYTNIIVHNNLQVENEDFFNSVNIPHITILINNYKESLDFSKSLWALIDMVEPRSIDLFFTESDFPVDNLDLSNIYKIRPLSNLYFFQTKSNKTIYEKMKENLVDVHYIDMTFKQYSSVVHHNKFSVNQKLFNESMNYNSYYNKKIYIDDKNSVSNGINSQKISNISDYNNYTNLLEDDKLKEFWDIRKDEIIICRDCEFRNMCIDPRNLISNDSKSWGHIEECDYNPYISKWKFEKGYLNLESSGIKKSNNEIDIDFEYLSTVMNEIWNNED